MTWWMPVFTVAALLTKHATLSLQEAYDMVDARIQRGKNQKAEQEISSLRQTARQAGYRTGGGTSVTGLNAEVPSDILNGPVEQLYAWLERQNV